MRVFFVAIISLQLASYASQMTSSLHEEQFVSLTLDDDDCVSQASQGEHDARLSKTLQLMNLAESLMRSAQGQKDEKAKTFARQALEKKNEKQEKRAVLSTHLALYQTHIEQMIDAIESLETDMRRYGVQIEQGEKSIEALSRAVSRENLHLEKLQLHSEVPQDAQRSAQERLAELITEKQIAESSLVDCETKKDKLQEHLTYNKAVMAEMTTEQALTQQELTQVTTIVAKLDTALIKIGKKYSAISPAVIASALEENGHAAATFDKKAFNGLYTQEKGNETLWETFCRLVGYKAR